MRRITFAVGIPVVLASGAAALAHEMLWTRRLVDLLGGSSESNTRVLSLFFLGLSLGAVLAQAILPRLRRPWRAAGWAELLIGLLAIPAYFLPAATQGLWPALGPDSLVGIEGRLTKLLVSVAVIVPPATAMGMTLPFFVAAILTARGHLAREGIWVYAINTGGGLLGLILTGGLLLPVLGASATMVSVILVNAALAMVCFGLDRLLSTDTAIAETGCLSTPSDAGSSLRWKNELDPETTIALPLLIAGLSGAGLLASEIVAIQTVMLAVPLSFFAPLAILATVILLLAIAAPLASRLARTTGRDERWWLPRSLATAGAVAVLTPVWYLSIAGRFGIESGSTVLGFTIKVAVMVLVTFGPLFLLLGLTFPLAIVLVGRYLDDRGGRRWVWLLAVNGVGGLLGAEFAYRVLLPTLGVHASLGAIGVAYLVAASLVSIRLDTRTSPSPVTLGGMTLIALAGVSGYLTKLPQINPYLGFKVLSEKVSADGLVAVVEGKGFGRGILVSNQYMLGSIGVKDDQQRQAHLPLILHPDPRHAAFIGLATGITPGAALQHEAVERVTVAEISREVVHAADRFFREHNEGITTSDRAQIVVEDGRTYIAASPDRFDVLVGDLYLPWGAGASRLYSVEHFRAARESLRSGGVFCQWLPMFQLRDSQFASICASFQQAFPRAYLFRNNADPMQPSMALVGFRDAELDWGVVRERCDQVRREGRVLDPSMQHWEAVAMLFLGLRRDPIPDTPLITLSNMHLEVDASRERITGSPGSKYLQGDRWMRFLAEQLPSQLVPETDPEIAVRQALGQLLIGWEWTHRTDPRAAEPIRQRIVGALPEPLLEAIRREPDRWPGNANLLTETTLDR